MEKLKFLANSVIRFIRRFWRTLLLIVIVSLTTLLLSTAISIWLSRFHNLHLPSFGTIRVIGVEASGGDLSISQDGNLSIDWGTVYPGTLTNRSFHVKSISTEPIILQLIFSNVTFKNAAGDVVATTPPVENPLRLTWNYSGESINPRQQIYVTLTLEISSENEFIDYIMDNDVREFFFDILIKPV